MKAADLSNQSVEELEQTLVSLAKDQFASRMQQSTGQLGQSHLLGQVKRDIARVKTVLREKKVSK